ncbi:tyrosine-type recombinase/integrase [Streptosporangium sp. NPDC048047]|uniref:tyrosine-type recombinase/integrase n=1 Tax=Streptosporangium sp. NPDC048047 TaxID=3155748 RepID=UPI0034204EAB
MPGQGRRLLIREAASLGDMHFRDLRHTCVTLPFNLGVPPQVVRDTVGHSDIEVAMTIYAHVSFDDKRRAPGKLGDAIGQKRFRMERPVSAGRSIRSRESLAHLLRQKVPVVVTDLIQLGTNPLRGLIVRVELPQMEPKTLHGLPSRSRLLPGLKSAGRS